jgi:zinc D-Ala-D-Ala carboxypeptidase
MFNIFKKEKHGMGALKSFDDPRNVPVSALPQYKATQGLDIPKEYKSDVSFWKIKNQYDKGTCCAQARSFIIEAFNKKEKVDGRISARFIYGQAKKVDGFLGQGTFPAVVAKNSKSIGSVHETVFSSDETMPYDEYIKVPSDKETLSKALAFRTKDYAFVDHTNPEEIARTLIKDGYVEATLTVGDWNRLPVKPTKRNGGNDGMHRVVLYGYKITNGKYRFYFVNSWGTNWGSKGFGYFDYEDYAEVEGSMREFIVDTDVPNEIKEEFKAKLDWPYKYFTPQEVINLKPELVAKLDLAREYAGIPFRLNSGFRTERNNEDVGGVKDSAHMYGLAVDIQCLNSSDRDKIIDAVKKAGFRRRGIAKTFVHVDCDMSKPQDVTWLYK